MPGSSETKPGGRRTRAATPWQNVRPPSSLNASPLKIHLQRSAELGLNSGGETETRGIPTTPYVGCKQRYSLHWVRGLGQTFRHSGIQASELVAMTKKIADRGGLDPVSYELLHETSVRPSRCSRLCGSDVLVNGMRHLDQFSSGTNTPLRESLQSLAIRGDCIVLASLAEGAIRPASGRSVSFCDFLGNFQSCSLREFWCRNGDLLRKTQKNDDDTSKKYTKNLIQITKADR